MLLFSYLDQNGGEKEPVTTKSSLHLFERFFFFLFGLEKKNKDLKIEKKNNKTRRLFKC